MAGGVFDAAPFSGSWPIARGGTDAIHASESSNVPAYLVAHLGAHVVSPGFWYQVRGSRGNAPLASSASALHWYSRTRSMPFCRWSGMTIVHGLVNTLGSSIATSYRIVSASVSV